jgi:hypothetical protein
MPIERRDGYRLWAGGPVPRGFDGITLGSMIVTRSTTPSAALVRHELVHVRQWRRHGRIGFLARYVGWYVWRRLQRHGHLGAYLRIPLEVEADWVTRRSLGTAVTDDIDGVDVEVRAR